MRVLVELLTLGGCGETCEDCRRLEATLGRVLPEVGLPFGEPSEGLGGRLRAAFGLGGGVIVRHLSCEESGDLSGAEPPALRINGRLVLAGPAWGEGEVRRALQRHMG